MYDTILVAIDASPNSPDDSLNRTTQFATMTGGTVHLLHVARGHLVPRDITAGAALGITSVEEDAVGRDLDLPVLREDLPLPHWSPLRLLPRRTGERAGTGGEPPDGATGAG